MKRDGGIEREKSGRNGCDRFYLFEEFSRKKESEGKKWISPPFSPPSLLKLKQPICGQEILNNFQIQRTNCLKLFPNSFLKGKTFFFFFCLQRKSIFFFFYKSYIIYQSFFSPDVFLSLFLLTLSFLIFFFIQPFKSHFYLCYYFGFLFFLLSLIIRRKSNKGNCKTFKAKLFF